MYGKITKYRGELGVGVIEADNGRKYRFTRTAVTNAGDDMVGQDVDFVMIGSRPGSIIMMSGSPWTAFGGLAHH